MFHRERSGEHGLSVWALHVLLMIVWVSSGASASSHSPKLFTGDAKLHIGMNVSMNSCLSLQCASTVINSQPVQDVACCSRSLFAGISLSPRLPQRTSATAHGFFYFFQEIRIDAAG